MAVWLALGVRRVDDVGVRLLRAGVDRNEVPISQPLSALGRSLDDYAAVIGGAA